jgi:F-type H+-transporting ATPase subunit epsilon
MPFELTVVTPEGQSYQGPVESVVLPGVMGQFTVLPGHEPLLTALDVGELTVRTDGEELHAAISSGFAEVHEDQLTVLVGSCEFAHEIDLERAELARARAQQQLERMRATAEGEELYQEYQESFSKAVTRVTVARGTPRSPGSS